MLTDENHSDIIFFVESLKQQKRKHSMVCGSVGIGRRARLRILWPLGRVGSSPIFRIREYELCKNSYGLRKCRNWQTSKIQVLVSVTLVRVQVPSSAWWKFLCDTGAFFCKQMPALSDRRFLWEIISCDIFYTLFYTKYPSLEHSACIKWW